ncbi:hypothetical protein O3P69_010269 [Scylla paramamosain]|uniref:Uncharacterized protein n=1 Tax=Scylla paramamosain TaxID=85552 RepID=A0AAW0TV56_SCYPA
MRHRGLAFREFKVAIALRPLSRGGRLPDHEIRVITHRRGQIPQVAAHRPACGEGHHQSTSPWLCVACTCSGLHSCLAQSCLFLALLLLIL